MEKVYSIWKFKLSGEVSQKISIPKEAKILSVEIQHNEMVVYAMVNTTIKETEQRKFRIIGTGDTTDASINNYVFLGTVLMADGEYVFHVFYQ